MTVIVPRLIGAITEDDFPDTARDYQTQIDKSKIVSGFEVQSSKKHGKFDPDKMEIARKVVEDYKSHDFPKIKGKEEQLKSEISRAVARTNKFAIFTPTTCYLYTCSEVSSMGYASFLEFYNYVIEMWEKFVMFWIDQVFYKGKVLVNFLKIKGNNNIFRSQARLPDLFTEGILFNLGICMILSLAGYLRYNKWQHPAPKNASAFNDLVLDFIKGEIHVINVYRKDFIDQFLNEFLGKVRGLKWKLILGGKDISGQGKQDFFLIPNINEVPGFIKVKNLLKLYKSWFKTSMEKTVKVSGEIGKELLDKKFSKLEDIEKARVLLILARMVNTKVYILKDYAFGVAGYLWFELPEFVDAIMDKDTILIDIETTNNPWLRTKNQILIAYIKGKYEDVNKRKNK